MTLSPSRRGPQGAGRCSAGFGPGYENSSVVFRTFVQKRSWLGGVGSAAAVRPRRGAAPCLLCHRAGCSAGRTPPWAGCRRGPMSSQGWKRAVCPCRGATIPVFEPPIFPGMNSYTFYTLYNKDYLKHFVELWICGSKFDFMLTEASQKLPPGCPHLLLPLCNSPGQGPGETWDAGRRGHSRTGPANWCSGKVSGN